MSPREAILALNLLPSFGPVRITRLLEAFGDAESVLNAPAKSLLRVEGIGPETAKLISSWQDHVDPAKELAEAVERGIAIITREDPSYPKHLLQAYDAPILLYVWGEITARDRHAISVVGSRRATTYGVNATRKLTYQLAHAGFTIVSGLARGIDTAAHEGALDAAGRTAAVVGHGLDLTFPPEAVRLRARMKADGCVLAEFPLGRPADRQTFPQRNRIVAGLVRVMVIVETDVDGGSMITARFAGDLGKTLCAVPGRADSPSSRGCHALIRDGATLVSSVDDILTELGESRGCPALALVEAPPEFARWLPHFGGGAAQDAESLAGLADCSVADAAVSLTLMEIRGVLVRRPDGRHERA